MYSDAVFTRFTRPYEKYTTIRNTTYIVTKFTLAGSEKRYKIHVLWHIATAKWYVIPFWLGAPISKGYKIPLYFASKTVSYSVWTSLARSNKRYLVGIIITAYILHSQLGITLDFHNVVFQIIIFLW